MEDVVNLFYFVQDFLFDVENLPLGLEKFCISFLFGAATHGCLDAPPLQRSVLLIVLISFTFSRCDS